LVGSINYHFGTNHKNLKDPSHPYRQKINSHFGNKVEVFDKATLLQGSGFNATSVKEQLNIMVFSFDSIRKKQRRPKSISGKRKLAIF
jgi:type III restriction enzyme